MKRIKPALPLALFFILLIVSCRKAAVMPTYPSTISLTFNGNLVNAKNPVAVYDSSKTAMQLLGQTTGNVIEVVVNGKMGLGKFNILTGQASINYRVGSDVYTATSGSVVITSFTNAQVTGSFEFAAADTAMVTGTGTNGTFTTPYTNQ